MAQTSKKINTVLLGLNELNFDYVKQYSKKYGLKGFNKVFKEYKICETNSEKEHKLLEPWIQWTTIYTGMSYNEHKVFRLGDIVNTNHEQIFESLENKGLKIGAVSPFNAKNNLSNPAFFVPDPWTKTNVSGNWLINSIYKSVSQSVNDNSKGKLKLSTVTALMIGVLICTPINKYLMYLNFFLKRKKPGIKAVILDSILSDMFLFLLKWKKPEFSNLFLNSGAHIQHHYLFNSKLYKGNFKNPEWYCPNNHDPLEIILKLYDKIIDKLLKSGYNIFIATGLHQEPHKKLTYYWRINEHDKFISTLGIKYKSLLPRMSRDFLIEFDNSKDCKACESYLQSFIMKSDNKRIFHTDNRGDSLFVELIYSMEIFNNDSIISKNDGKELKNFKKYVSFVAIKNGEHNGLGYFIYDPKYNKKRLPKKIELRKLREIIENTTLSLVNSFKK